MSDVKNGARSWICAVVAVSFAALAISGLMMLSDQNSGRNILNLHVVMGIILIVSGIIHLVINAKTFISHVKKPVAIVAAAVAVLVAAALLLTGGPGGSGPHRYGPGHGTDIDAGADFGIGSVESGDTTRGFGPGGRFGNGRRGSPD